MVLTEKQQKWLEQLVFEGQVMTNIAIMNSLMTLELRSLTGELQLEAEKEMSAVDGTAVYTLHMFAIFSLSKALASVKAKGVDIKFGSSTEALAFIKSRPTTIIDEMVRAHANFEKELKEITTPQTVSENFSQTPGTGDASVSTSAA
jgi:hypothetical protein